MEMFLEDKEMKCKWLAGGAGGVPNLKGYFDATGRVVKDDTLAKQIKLVLSDRDMITYKRRTAKEFK